MSDNTLTFKLAGPSDIQAYRRIKMIINLVLSCYIVSSWGLAKNVLFKLKMIP